MPSNLAVDGSPSPTSRTRVPPPAPLRPQVLAAIATGIAAAEPLWRAVVRHEPDGRRPVRLLATEQYEVWVIGWTTGQNVRVHDHGPSSGALVVVEGQLAEVIPHRAGGAVERTLGTGRLRHLAAGLIHDVVNRADAPATSIHVYSPPMTTMTYYDATTLAPIETEVVAVEQPVLPGRAGSFLLHPANRG